MISIEISGFRYSQSSSGLSRLRPTTLIIDWQIPFYNIECQSFLSILGCSCWRGFSCNGYWPIYFICLSGKLGITNSFAFGRSSFARGTFFHFQRTTRYLVPESTRDGCLCTRFVKLSTENTEKLLDHSGLSFRVPSVLADRFDIVTAEIWSNSSIEPKSSSRFRAFFLCNPRSTSLALSWVESRRTLFFCQIPVQRILKKVWCRSSIGRLYLVGVRTSISSNWSRSRAFKPKVGLVNQMILSGWK